MQRNEGGRGRLCCGERAVFRIHDDKEDFWRCGLQRDYCKFLLTQGDVRSCFAWIDQGTGPRRFLEGKSEWAGKPTRARARPGTNKCDQFLCYSPVVTRGVAMLIAEKVGVARQSSPLQHRYSASIAVSPSSHPIFSTFAIVKITAFVLTDGDR